MTFDPLAWCVLFCDSPFGAKIPAKADMPQTRYEILGPIGAGASSRVDKARDTLIDRTVVLKTIGNGFGSPELQKQFLREAQILGRLSHPNIISIYDLGLNDDGSAYLVMEYVPGKTLESVMSEKGAIPLARAGVWAGDLASALGRAHRAGIIHGDVKPANIFVTDDGQIKLGDFGIARFATQVSGSARLVGTPAYLSPEQIKGETQDHRSDIFSIGIVLYQLVTGMRPFDGTSVAAVCAQIVALEPPPPSRHNPGLPKEFDRIVMRCLAKNPADRYASGESLAASLYPFARNKPEPAAPRLDFSWFNRPLRPLETWIGSGAVAVALLAIPVVHNFNRAHSRSAVDATAAQVIPQTDNPAGSPASPPPLAPASPPASLRFSPPSDSTRSASAPALKTSPSKTPRVPGPGMAHTAAPKPSLSNVPRGTLGAANTPQLATTDPGGRSTPPLPAKPQPVSHALGASSAVTSPVALDIEITSAIEGETLAVFADQQLVATSPLSITKAAAPLHLNHALAAGPHEFRIALYRQDNSLHLERQGLAEIQPGASNLLSIHVVKRAKMLVKRDAELQILWPSLAPPSEAAPSTAPSKRTAPLVASSVPASPSR